MNIPDVMKAKQAWDTFTANHPKFPAFLNAARNMGIREGTVIGVSITDPEGHTIDSNVKLTASDLELIEMLRAMRQ
ncbi:MAG: hypothetical protein K5886_07035 [Lachnospiraceae bacterium]|nr:hypothetical protein [Lachnospiraceae bacterium]